MCFFFCFFVYYPGLISLWLAHEANVANVYLYSVLRGVKQCKQMDSNAPQESQMRDIKVMCLQNRWWLAN